MYMDSFVQTPCSRSLPKGTRIALRRTARAAACWDKALLLNGLECRAPPGNCKLRFVSRSEDVWYSNSPRTRAKRAAGAARCGSSKRQRLQSFMNSRMGEGCLNALAGLGPPQSAPLPSEHKLKPLEA